MRRLAAFRRAGREYHAGARQFTAPSLGATPFEVAEAMDPWFFRIGFAYAAAAGACLGSFVNVVIARLPEGQSVVRPRSRCMACKNFIAWYDNIPILSFLLLRGRCRKCQAPFALRYLLIEVLMAGLSAALFVRLGPTTTFFTWLPLSAALLAITFLDIDHWWVPDVITLPAGVFVGLSALLPGRAGFHAALLGLIPAICLFIFGWVFTKLTRQEGLGLGDVKLLAVLGMALGLADTLTVLLIAALQGAIVGSFVVWRGGHQSGRSKDPPALADDAEWQPHPHAVPFGPFLALGAFEVVLLPDIFTHWHQRLTEVLLQAMS